MINPDEELVSFDETEKTYEFNQISKTNQRTCINIQPIVRVGDKVIQRTGFMSWICYR